MTSLLKKHSVLQFCAQKLDFILTICSIFQFYRSFPKPPGVTDEDVFLLVLKYRDPDKPGLVNYLNIHHDLLAVSQRDSDIAKSAFPHYKNVTDYLPTQVSVLITGIDCNDHLLVVWGE